MGLCFYLGTTFAGAMYILGTIEILLVSGGRRLAGQRFCQGGHWPPDTGREHGEGALGAPAGQEAGTQTFAPTAANEMGEPNALTSWRLRLFTEHGQLHSQVGSFQVASSIPELGCIPAARVSAW